MLPVPVALLLKKSAKSPSSMSNSSTNIDSTLICPICLDPYHNPKVLKCGHSLCSNCVFSMSHRLTSGGAIECPQCRNRTLLTQGEQLPINYALKDAVETALRFYRENKQLREYGQRLWQYEYPKARQATDLLKEMFTGAANRYQTQRTENEVMWTKIQSSAEDRMGCCLMLLDGLENEMEFFGKNYCETTASQAIMIKEEIDSHSLMLGSRHEALMIELQMSLSNQFGFNYKTFSFTKPDNWQRRVWSAGSVIKEHLTFDNTDTTGSLFGNIRRFFGKMLYGNEPAKKCSSCTKNTIEKYLSICLSCCAESNSFDIICHHCFIENHKDHEEECWIIYKDRLERTSKSTKSLCNAFDKLISCYKKQESATDNCWIDLKNVLAESVDRTSTDLAQQAVFPEKEPSFCIKVQQESAEIYENLLQCFSRIDDAQLALHKALVHAQTELESLDLKVGAVHN